jgi:large subunit ribosomal protein L18Ae
LWIAQVFEKNPNTVKNFGVLIKYDSRSGTHTMYKEYRDLTVNGAVAQMYAEMAGRHRARA